MRNVYASHVPGHTGRSGASNCDPTSELCNPLASDSLLEFLETVVDVLIQFGIPIAALFLVYSGFLFVTARGNTEKLQTARRNFYWVIIGIAILLGAKIIISIIADTVVSLEP